MLYAKTLGRTPIRVPKLVLDGWGVGGGHRTRPVIAALTLFIMSHVHLCYIERKKRKRNSHKTSMGVGGGHKCISTEYSVAFQVRIKVYSVFIKTANTRRSNIIYSCRIDTINLTNGIFLLPSSEIPVEPSSNAETAGRQQSSFFAGHSSSTGLFVGRGHRHQVSAGRGPVQTDNVTVGQRALRASHRFVHRKAGQEQTIFRDDDD